MSLELYALDRVCDVNPPRPRTVFPFHKSDHPIPKSILKTREKTDSIKNILCHEITHENNSCVLVISVTSTIQICQIEKLETVDAALKAAIQTPNPKKCSKCT